ncbi:MAG: MotA/TolQ/ExbB proton channel family protein [Bacteroidia bacterium]|nr:MotA/TolQ/ExbB proton channel family protein [Bacteroidia bacterium]
MKKLFALLVLAFCLTWGVSVSTFAQENPDTIEQGGDEAEAEPAPTTAEDANVVDADTPVEIEEQSFHQLLKEKFIEGGWEFMSLVLICLIIGLAVALERVITLNLASTNNRRLIQKVEDALNAGGVDAAKEVTQNTRGPVASIFTQGLMRYSEGIDMVEKSVISYGSVEMAKLEKGLVWIALFIALAPMLGFLGTVWGMVLAFDAIEAAGDISPTLVAGGIKVALLTTLAGLAVAIILQIFYNYLSSKVSSLVASMEEASISLVDLLVAYRAKQSI